MASTPSSCTFLLNFCFLPVFVVVFLIIRLIVTSYWLPMKNKRFFPHIGLSVFIDFQRKLVILMAVETLKTIFQY